MEAVEPIQQQMYSVRDFQVLSPIGTANSGTGQFGRVLLVRHPSHSKPFALKVLRKASLHNDTQREHAGNEREVLQRLAHPFVNKLYPAPRFACFEDCESLYFLLEHVPGGELSQRLQGGSLPPRDCQFYSSELAVVLDYLHSEHIIYRDLKPANVMLGADGHVKLVDFGLAKVVTEK